MGANIAAVVGGSGLLHDRGFPRLSLFFFSLGWLESTHSLHRVFFFCWDTCFLVVVLIIPEHGCSECDHSRCSNIKHHTFEHVLNKKKTQFANTTRRRHAAYCPDRVPRGPCRFRPRCHAMTTKDTSPRAQRAVLAERARPAQRGLRARVQSRR